MPDLRLDKAIREATPYAEKQKEEERLRAKEELKAKAEAEKAKAWFDKELSALAKDFAKRAREKGIRPSNYNTVQKNGFWGERKIKVYNWTFGFNKNGDTDYWYFITDKGIKGICSVYGNANGAAVSNALNVNWGEPKNIAHAKKMIEEIIQKMGIILAGGTL